MSDAEELLLELRRRGVHVEVVADHLRLDAPQGTLTSQLLERVAAAKLYLLQMLTEADRRLALPLSRFAIEGPPLEALVPWWDETIWFVPGAGDVQALLEAGVGRGRIWTAAELLQIADLGGMTDGELYTVGRVKALFDAAVVREPHSQPTHSPSGLSPRLAGKATPLNRRNGS